MQLLYSKGAITTHTHAHALKKKKDKQTENNEAKLFLILKASFSEAHFAINLPTIVTAANSDYFHTTSYDWSEWTWECDFQQMRS